MAPSRGVLWLLAALCLSSLRHSTAPAVPLDLVLGAAIGIPPAKLVPTLASLRRHCPATTTRVVVATDDTATAEWGVAYGVEAVPPATDGELGGHPQQTRYFPFLQYLQREGQRFRFVLVMDLTDVVVQGNPFDHFAQRENQTVLVGGAEPIFLARDKTFNAKWYTQCYGGVHRVKRRRVINSGLVLGPPPAMLRYLALQVQQARRKGVRRCQCNDQAVLNFLVYQNRTVAMDVLPYNNTLMMSVHWRPTDVYWDNATRSILTQWGTRPVLLHQGNRNAALWAAVTRHFGAPPPSPAPDRPPVATATAHATHESREAALLDRFNREPGLRKLIRWFVDTLAQPRPRWPDDCPAAPSPARCVTARDLEPDAAADHVPLAAWLQPAPVAVAPFNTSGLYRGFPYVTGSAFYALADYTWSTYYPWLRGIVYNDTFDPATIPNRSLVFWNLNKNGPDLGWLRQKIGQFRTHFFLITHLVDNVHLPPWVLDHPLVLKVFAPNVPPALWNHSKVVPLPWGIAAGKACLEVNAARRNASARAPAALFNIGHFGGLQTGPPIRTVRLRNFMKLLQQRGFSVRQIGARKAKAEYLAELCQHRFSLCPPRGGYDSFRVWEVLYLGRVPVLGWYLPDALLADLPHLRLDWATFGVPAMEAGWRALQNRTFRRDKLWIQWWVRKILLECLAVP